MMLALQRNDVLLDLPPDDLPPLIHNQQLELVRPRPGPLHLLRQPLDLSERPFRRVALGHYSGFSAFVAAVGWTTKKIIDEQKSQ